MSAGLYRRQGYENAPVGFGLCPALQEKYKEVAGEMPMAEYFDYPAGFAERGAPARERSLLCAQNTRAKEK